MKFLSLHEPALNQV